MEREREREWERYGSIASQHSCLVSITLLLSISSRLWVSWNFCGNFNTHVLAPARKCLICFTYTFLVPAAFPFFFEFMPPSSSLVVNGKEKWLVSLSLDCFSVKEELVSDLDGCYLFCLGVGLGRSQAFQPSSTPFCYFVACPSFQDFNLCISFAWLRLVRLWD